MKIKQKYHNDESKVELNFYTTVHVRRTMCASNNPKYTAKSEKFA